MCLANTANKHCFWKWFLQPLQFYEPLSFLFFRFKTDKKWDKELQFRDGRTGDSDWMDPGIWECFGVAGNLWLAAAQHWYHSDGAGIRIQAVKNIWCSQRIASGCGFSFKPVEGRDRREESCIWMGNELPKQLAVIVGVRTGADKAQCLRTHGEIEPWDLGSSVHGIQYATHLEYL